MKVSRKQKSVSSKTTERMSARGFVFCLLLTVLLLTGSSGAQQVKKTPRIGYVSQSYANDPGPGLTAFRQGLRDIGYVEGKNILFEYRYAERL